METCVYDLITCVYTSSPVIDAISNAAKSNHGPILTGTALLMMIQITSISSVVSNPRIEPTVLIVDHNLG